MKILKCFGLMIVVALLTSHATAQRPQWESPDYDAVRDFSGQSNPNGVWSYGYLETWGAPFTLFPWGGTCDIQGVTLWRIYDCNTESPSLIHNDTSEPVCWLTLCVPPNYLLLDPRSQLTTLRWVAPSSGRYLMHVMFGGLDWAGPTSTGVHVLLNSKKSLLSGPITSYAWPLTFTQKGSMTAGDTVDFIVDWGKDADFGYDSTGLEVKIWKLQEPL